MAETTSQLPISVLSLNPAVDVTYDVPHLISDQKVRAQGFRYDPGGSGINVSRGLKRLNVKAQTFCVIAGGIGRVLAQQLDEELDSVTYQEVAGETRVNATILESDTGSQYEVIGAGPTVSKAQWEHLLDQFVVHCREGLGILCGSLQHDLPEDLFAEAVRRVQAAGGRAIIDSHGQPLRHAIRAQPYLIKPNRFELEALAGHVLSDDQAIIQEARRLLNQGVGMVCVSMDEGGVLLVAPSLVLKGEAPSVEVVSTVGAGDSMVAGLAGRLAQGASVEDALREGIACSVATIQQPGTELFDPETVGRLRSEVRIMTLSGGRFS